MALISICKHTLHPRLITPQSIVVDCGANKGEFSHALIETFGCRCHAIEPNPEMCERIAPHPQLTKYAIALHERNEPVVLNIATDPEATSLMQLRGCDYVDTITVNGQTLESFVREAGIRSIDVLKLDIEGAEVAVFGTSSDRFLASIGQITIEFHNDLGGMSDADVQQIVDRLRRLGFYVLYPGRHLTPWDVLFVNAKRMSFLEYWWIKYGLQIPTAIRNRWRRLRARVGRRRG